MSRWTSKNTTVVFEDAVGTTLAISPGPGDFSIDNLTEGNADAQSSRNRGVHDCWVEGDDLIQSWSITRHMPNESITDATLARVLDWIRRTGIYDPSTGSTPLTSVESTMWAFKVRVSMSDGSNTASVLLPNNRAIAALAEGTAPDGHALSISGTNVEEPTYT